MLSDLLLCWSVYMGIGVPLYLLYSKYLEKSFLTFWIPGSGLALLELDNLHLDQGDKDKTLVIVFRPGRVSHTKNVYNNVFQAHLLYRVFVLYTAYRERLLCASYRGISFCVFNRHHFLCPHLSVLFEYKPLMIRSNPHPPRRGVRHTINKW